MNDRKNILVITTGYPINSTDNSNIFLKTLYQKMASLADYQFVILAADSPLIKEKQTDFDRITVKRYSYWLKDSQRLVYGDSILSNLKKNPVLLGQAAVLVISMFIKTCQEIRRIKPVLLHAHWALPAGLVAVICGKFFRIPVLVTSHGSDIYGFGNWLGKILLKLVFRNSKRINVVSRLIKDYIIDIAGQVVGEKIFVQPMGADETKFRRINNARETLNFKRDQKIILYVGRLSEGKGIEYLIRSALIFKKGINSFKVLIIGVGNEQAKLKNLIYKLGLTDNIFFLGSIANDQLPLYYSTADVLVVPSVGSKTSQEGLPVTIIEGLLTGCKIVASSIGGVADLTDMKAVRLVKPGDIDQLAAAILKSFNQPDQERDAKIDEFSLTSEANTFISEYKKMALS